MWYNMIHWWVVSIFAFFIAFFDNVVEIPAILLKTSRAFDFRKVAPLYVGCVFCFSIIILYEDVTDYGWPRDPKLPAWVLPFLYDHKNHFQLIRFINYVVSDIIMFSFLVRVVWLLRRGNLNRYESYGTIPLTIFWVFFAAVGIIYEVLHICQCEHLEYSLEIVSVKCSVLNTVHRLFAALKLLLLTGLIIFNKYVPRETLPEQVGLTHICTATLVGLVWTLSKEEMHIYEEVFPKNETNLSFEERAVDKQSKEIFSFESIAYVLMLEFLIVAFGILCIMIFEGGQNNGNRVVCEPNQCACPWKKLYSGTVIDSALVIVIAVLMGILIIWVNVPKQSPSNQQEKELRWILLDAISMFIAEVIVGIIPSVCFLFRKSIPEPVPLSRAQVSTPEGTPTQSARTTTETTFLLQAQTSLPEGTSTQPTANDHEQAGPSRDISAQINPSDQTLNEHSKIAEWLDMQFFYFGYFVMLLYGAASKINCLKNTYNAETLYDKCVLDMITSISSLIQAFVQGCVILYKKEDLSKTKKGYMMTLSLLFLNICMFFVNLADLGDISPKCNKAWFFIVKSTNPACMFFPISFCQYVDGSSSPLLQTP